MRRPHLCRLLCLWAIVFSKESDDGPSKRRCIKVEIDDQTHTGDPTQLACFSVVCDKGAKWGQTYSQGWPFKCRGELPPLAPNVMTAWLLCAHRMAVCDRSSIPSPSSKPVSSITLVVRITFQTPYCRPQVAIQPNPTHNNTGHVAAYSARRVT